MKTDQQKTDRNRMIRMAVQTISIVTLLTFLAGCMTGNDTWYTQAEDTYVSEHNTGGMPFDFSGAGGMKYSYTIPCWNDEGQMQKLTFGSDERFEPDTYLQLETQPIRGVVSWKEVAKDEVPEDVLEKIAETMKNQTASEN